MLFWPKLFHIIPCWKKKKNRKIKRWQTTENRQHVESFYGLWQQIVIVDIIFRSTMHVRPCHSIINTWLLQCCVLYEDHHRLPPWWQFGLYCLHAKHDGNSRTIAVKYYVCMYNTVFWSACEISGQWQ
jgi:hypothetical protein